MRQNMEYLFDDVDFDSFGDTLNYYREHRGVSMTALAEAAGIGVSYVLRLERGERDNPSFRVVIAIAFALGLNLKQTNTLLWQAGFAPLQAVSNYRPSGRKSWGNRQTLDP